ncbi:MAG: helicase C-terminal domain-containing protein [Verrucomicrobiales bacterium]|nr:helicase C-terminal domain-containing protein [Verrucomicrobiales bacterium]
MISISEFGHSAETLSRTTAEFFGSSGALSKLKDFEFRPQQQQMAVAVARALEEERPLVVEAGTGVGKSLAYLAPAVRKAIDERRKAIISTHTINLQEQLIDKDIPLLQSVMNEPFKAMLLKGRRNYLCPNRLQIAMSGGGEMFTSSELEELKAIWEWAEKTKDGTLSDLDFAPSGRVWSQVCSESHVCTPRRCGSSGKCFYQEVKKQVAEADVLVVNHTLFFTLLNSQAEFTESGEGFLFAGDFLIFDEAHTLEQVAARQLGINLTQIGMKFDLHRLFNPKNKKGLFAVAGDSQGRRSTMKLLDDIDDFFTEIEETCKWGEYGREFRIRDPEFVEDTLGAGLIEVGRRARTVADLAEDSMKSELTELARRLADCRAALATFLDQSEEGLVYWVEKGERDSISLNAAPVDVAELLRPVFFERNRPCVFTSATLGIGDRDLNYFRQRVGAEEVEAIQIGSPFHYEEQMTIHLVKEMPQPNESGYEAALIKWIRHFVKLSKGSAFVLFTSYSLLKRVSEAMQDFFEDENLELLVQGRGKSRGQLIEQFKKDTTSVLFGTDSFWTGVDVPGEALTNVIITRLPFAVPDHPLTQARLEKIEEGGGNSFMEYSVPEAILKLRQGVGRLIRSGEDEGLVVLLDNRVLSKRYGKAFLNALPEAPVVVAE